jgi:hypothetical protein
MMPSRSAELKEARTMDCCPLRGQAAVPRVLVITLAEGRLFGNMDGRGKVPLIASSETLFGGLSGLGVEFIQNGALLVKHVSGDYRFVRK